MYQEKELLEAKRALLDTMTRVKAAQKAFKSAKNWGIYDTFFDGGLFASMIKRGKIREANQALEKIRQSLIKAEKELGDVHLSIRGVKDRGSDQVLDIYFDNIFTDLRVQGEIKAAINNLDHLELELARVLRQVESQLQK